MNSVQRDKAWARRFGRGPGDCGIRHSGKHYRMPVAIWTPTVVPANKRSWNVTVPKPRQPVADCPMPETPIRPVQYIKQESK